MFKDITTPNNEGTTSLKIYGYSRYQFKVQDEREICRFFLCLNVHPPHYK